MKFSLFATLVFVALFFYACEGENPMHYDANATSSLTIQFDNVVGNADLQLNTGAYVNSLGQPFQITTFKYFISNIRLTNTNGSVYAVPQDASYFFVDESDEKSQFIRLKDVPEGEYNELEFTLGVDSLRNTKDVQYRTGVLEITQPPANDMYWTWNSGYIFLKLEGTSAAIKDAGNEFQYHVGGFGGYHSSTPNNVREIKLHLAARGTPKVKVGRTPNVHIFVDVMKALEGEVQINFASSPRITMPAPANTTIVKNYVRMFSHDHTEP